MRAQLAILFLLLLCAATLPPVPAGATPFNRVDRLDVNGADVYDYMDVDEIDYLRALKLVERRRTTGEYAKIEDLTDVIPPDLFGMIADTVEVGSYKGPRDQFYSGNSFSDVKWYMDRDRNYAWRGLYNFNLSNRVFARIAYDKGTAENNLSFDELFLDYYNWSDGFFPKNTVVVPRPTAEVRARVEEGYDDLENRVLADFNSRYGHEMSIGRQRRQQIQGLYESDLDSYQKYWLTKKPIEKPRRKPRKGQAAPAAAAAAPAPAASEKPLLPYKMKVPKAETPVAKTSGEPVMTGIWTFGSVMFPQSARPLIALPRTEYKGVKYERILDNFHAALLYKKNDNRDEQVVGGNAFARVANGDAIVGAKADRIYSKAVDNDVQYVSMYGMGDVNGGQTHLYGEYQTVMNGASSLYGLVTSRFRDLFVTTKLLSVKEDWQGPNHVAPFTFDGEFTSHLRLSYLFSDISSVSVWTERSKVYAGEPDFLIGTREETGLRMFLKATGKALFSVGYSNRRTPAGFTDDVYSGRLRYRYKPRLEFYVTTEFTDRDVQSRLGRLSDNTLEFRFRVRDNIKVNVEFTDRWDEAYAATAQEHEGIGRINYYYNF